MEDLFMAIPPDTRHSHWAGAEGPLSVGICCCNARATAVATAEDSWDTWSPGFSTMTTKLKKKEEGHEVCTNWDFTKKTNIKRRLVLHSWSAVYLKQNDGDRYTNTLGYPEHRRTWVTPTQRSSSRGRFRMECNREKPTKRNNYVMCTRTTVCQICNYRSCPVLRTSTLVAKAEVQSV